MTTKSYRNDFHGKNPYYDDFDPAKKFVRIMSRPGLPLQAREITQLQTILQNQIERIGDHFFEEGASVRGGDITEANGVALRLANTSYTTDQLKSFINKVIQNASSGVRARITSFADKSATLSNDEYQILFATYITSGSFDSGDTLEIAGTLPLETVDLIPAANSGPPAVSIATNIVGINTGIYYADGFFIESDAESIAVAGTTYDSGADASHRDFSNPSASIGYDIKRELISSDEDESLKDPSFGFYNFNSPGADRYKVTLELSQKDISGGLTFDSEDYFEIMRIINGETTKQVRYTDYAIFEDTLARRTFDESGNYTVRPFQITTASHSEAFGQTDETKHAIKIDSGKAYIGGYEFETIAPRYIAVSKGRTTNRIQQATLSTKLENYVTLISSNDVQKGDERTTFTKNQKASIQRNTTEIGTCNVRSIEDVVIDSTTTETRLYLFNINMTNSDADDGISAFKDSTHIAVNNGTSNVQRFQIGTETGDTPLENIGPSRQIFKAPIGSGLIRASGSDGLVSSFLVKKPYTFDIASGAATITSTKPFLDGTESNYVIYYDDSSSGDGATKMKVGDSTNGFVLTTNNNDTSPKVTITKGSSVVDSGEGTIIASQRWQSDASSDIENNIRVKTLVDSTMGAKLGNATTGIIELDHCDVFSLTTLNDGVREVSSSFELDVNSGVDAYRRSRLILRAGATCATDEDGNLVINSASYKRFQHSGDGPFTVDSYPLTQITYEEIPNFTDPETGEIYSLADAYDFRPVATDANNTSFDNGSGGAQVVAFSNPVNTSTVSYEHYLSRIDSVVLDRQTREFKIVEGKPSVSPIAPELDSLDMNLGNLIVPPYTRLFSDIKYRYIDNQRSTMMDINEIEGSQQFDSYYAFKNDLEQEALNRAQNFRSSRTAFSDGIFVDTFIGHNNAVTAKRSHNCSIDPENGELRPAFESTFIRMGITGASLGSDIVHTDDNIFLPTSTSVVYDSNMIATDIISANQFAVADYLGTMKVSPSSDNYFTSRKPLVMVNAIGEVDNWETTISAFQRGRASGFGSQWRDWETLWFGSRKRNDVNVEHDSSSSEYTNPRRSSYVSRVISDKLLKRIGNKIVDLSIVPYINARTITYTAENLKPSTLHRVFFDGVQMTQTTPLPRTDIAGKISGSFICPNNILTGKKLIRIVNTNDGTLDLATSSADAVYYAEGLLDTKEGDSYSVRPVITRRKASNVDDVSSDYYDANSANNLSRSYNSLTPFAQEISVDPTNFPNGIMLKDIELFFSKVATGTSLELDPIKVHIRPMYNGAPHPFKVLPFSEITRTNVRTAKYDSPIGSGEKFEFSTPVYLKPNTNYAICISTNGNYELFYGEEGEVEKKGDVVNATQGTMTTTKPLYFGSLHLPLNNGTSTAYDNRFLKMAVNQCSFGVSESGDSINTSSVKFETDISLTVPYHVCFIHSNTQPSDAVNPVYDLTSSKQISGSIVRNNIDVNTTIDDWDDKLIIAPDQPLSITTKFISDSKGAVASMVDGDRLGFLAVNYMANNDDGAATTEELQPTSRLASNRSRYIGRKVNLDRAADDIVVMVDGSYVNQSKIRVYVKLQGPDQPNGVFDDNDYEELFPEGNPTPGEFEALKPTGEVGGVMRFTTNNLLPGTSTEFTAYQVKILLMGQNIANNGSAREVPVINTVSAVPLRRVSQDEIRRYTPAGTVLSWAGGAAPFGFVLCDGSSYNIATQPEFKILKEAIGSTFNLNTDPGGNQFRVPDLRGRTIVGTSVSSPTSSTYSLSERTISDSSGSESITLTKQQLPPHSHALGEGRDTEGAGQQGEDNYNPNDLRVSDRLPDGAFIPTSTNMGGNDDGKQNAIWTFDGKWNSGRHGTLRPVAGKNPPISNTTDPEDDEGYRSMAGRPITESQKMDPFLVLNYIIKI